MPSGIKWVNSDTNRLVLIFSVQV